MAPAGSRLFICIDPSESLGSRSLFYVRPAAAPQPLCNVFAIRNPHRGTSAVQVDSKKGLHNHYSGGIHRISQRAPPAATATAASTTTAAAATAAAVRRLRWVTRLQPPAGLPGPADPADSRAPRPARPERRRQWPDSGRPDGLGQERAGPRRPDGRPTTTGRVQLGRGRADAGPVEEEGSEPCCVRCGPPPPSSPISLSLSLSLFLSSPIQWPLSSFIVYTPCLPHLSYCGGGHRWVPA